jgi:xylan 1,4-beta-xylosidase
VKTSHSKPSFVVTGAFLAIVAFGVLSVTRASAQTVSVFVNWESQTGQEATYKSYGLNVYHGMDPAVAGIPGNPKYKAGVTFMRPGIIRYHYAGQMDDSKQDPSGWIVSPETPSYHWDEEKIAKAFDDSYPYGPERLVDIVNWPAYLDDGKGHLNPREYPAYAKLCAKLVDLLNVKLHRRIRYFEVFNELENGSGSPYDGNMAEAGKIYNMAAQAMKEVDPTIKVGGPAFARPDLTYNLDDFFSTAAPNVDFVSFHSYVAGTTCGYDPDNQTVFDSAALGYLTVSTRSEFVKYSNSPIEYFLDEFNISYCPPDVRMNNIIGAIFDALALADNVNQGSNGTMAWNEADGWYGKLDGDWNRRPSAYLYHILNRYVLGRVVATTSSDMEKVVPFAVVRNHQKTLMLINRAEAPEKVKLSFQGLENTHGDLSVLRVSQHGLSGVGLVGCKELTKSVTLPANTITVLRLVADRDRDGGHDHD